MLQILSHVNKRIDGNKEIVLPLESLVEVLKEADQLNHALMKNLTLVYVENAFQNSDPMHCLQAVSLCLDILFV